MTKCISGKRAFDTQSMAEEMLVELWTRNEYMQSHAPISVYKCDDCGYFHLTSREPMNEKLAAYLSSDKFRLNKEANRWLEKFRRK